MKKHMDRKLVNTGIFILLCSIPSLGSPQTLQSDTIDVEAMPADEILERDLVSYPPSFFDRFRPITALDIVNQVPGFQLKSSFNFNNVRGFANSSGNVLIDDRRPSTKSDSLASILSRIPATSVQRIELIRGQVRSIDLRGESTVVNLVLREGIPAAIQWEAWFRHTFADRPVKPNGKISLSDNWRGVDYNAGISARTSAVGRTGSENIFDAMSNIQESRLDNRENRNTFLSANLNTNSWWGETFVQINTSLNYGKRHTYTDSFRTDKLTNTQEDIFFDDTEKYPGFEIGLDLERFLLPNFLAKGIVLYAQNNEEFLNTQRENDGNGQQTLFREGSGNTDAEEIIGRLELDWSSFSNHLIQGNIERAHNVLDGSLIQTDDTGSGPVIIDVPGANSRVEEIRWDFLLKDTWILGRFELEYGLGAEASKIIQTGDAELERDFFFIKPQAILNYSSANSDQTRLSLMREIAQLDLEDFISATEFLDNDVALGNPNIKPDATWKLELSQEKRFGGDAVVKLTAYHDWITDVLDLLPLTPTFEAPGNIGDGRRWGLHLESTLPLDWVGLRASKLDIKLRWQDSTVVDPVTAENRVLSIGRISNGPVFYNIENRYGIQIDYRQDFQAQQVAWGWHIGERAEQVRFKVNEFEEYNDGMEFRVFVETTRWEGIKIRLAGENLLDFADVRDRTLFIAERDLSTIESRQIRARTRARRLLLTVSGGF